MMNEREKGKQEQIKDLILLVAEHLQFLEKLLQLAGLSTKAAYLESMLAGVRG